MKYELKTIKDKKIEITIKLDAAEWDKAINNAYNKKKGKYSVQGFSKGKAPRKIIEKFYGEGIFYEDAIDGCFYEYYFEVLNKEQTIKPIAAPEVDIKEISPNGVVMTATIEGRPDVKLGEYKGLKIEYNEVKIGDKEVNERLTKMAQERARFVDVTGRAVKNGDFVTIDFSGSVDGVKFEGGTAKDYDLEIGSKSFIEGFEDQIVGMKTGETKNINVKFPDNYHAAELKGKPSVFEVVLKAIKEKDVPELNDSFAADASEFETLKDLKEDIKNKLTDEVQHKEMHEQENRLIDKVVENATVDVPKTLIDQQIDDFVADFEQRLAYQGMRLNEYLAYSGSDLQTLKESRAEDAKKTVKTRLVLEEIIKTENIKVSEAELVEKYNEARSDKKTLEQIKTEMPREQLMYLENNLLINKLLKMLKENNNIKSCDCK